MNKFILGFNNTCLITKNCNMNLLIKENISLEIKSTNKNIPLISNALKKLFKLSEEDFEERGQLGVEYINKYHNWEEIISEEILFYKNLNSVE